MSKGIIRKVISSAIAIAVAFGGLVVASTTSPASAASTGPQISKIGTKAFEDLATCLASYKKPVLDVFYLVDYSQSLTYTDPEYVRSDVLGSSVAELKSFSDRGVTVNYAASFFADTVEKIQGWTTLESESDFTNAREQMTSSMENNFGSYTDWEKGLSYANKQLSSKPDAHCKMLIWFTDGGINPDSSYQSIINSLARLCNLGINSSELGNADGPYGLLAQMKKNQISIFGVLYQNDESTFKDRKDKGDTDREAQEFLDSEHNRMEFMAPLVEGIGRIETVSEGLPGPGKVQCGPLGENGFSPAGQPNGAFVRAQDPVDLAFQFLSMQAVLAGGSGKQIVDGKFEVPSGTAAFRILTTSTSWKLTGPDSSNVTLGAKNLKANPNIAVTTTAGVQQIDFTVSGKKKMLGTWKFDSGKSTSALYLFSGLTINLDRDQTSQIVSDRENSLTGQIVRRDEFSSMPIDLSVYSKAELNLSQPDAAGNLVPISNVRIAIDKKSGQFKVEGLKPEADTRALDLWVSLDLGEEFSPVTANFGVDVVLKSDIATASSNIIKLTTLEGPDGKATGTITVVGPTAQPESEFCLSDPAVRTDDAQTAARKHPRAESWSWSFDGNPAAGTPYCVTVANGETKTISVVVTNPTQADSNVVSIRNANSTSAGAAMSESIQFEFQTKTKTDAAVEFWVVVTLLILGILVPLALLYLMNWLTTRFLPLEKTVRAEYPVQITTGATAKLLDKNGSPLKVEANDFKFMTDGPAAKTLAIGSHGEAQAKIAAFPLLPSWFEQNANPGQRVISLYSESGKGPSHFKDGKATEISPNHASNWFISVPDAEFAKANGETMNGTLVVAARMGSLPQYQSRVQELAAKPGLQGRIDEIRSAMEAEAAKNNGKTPKEPKARKGDKPGVGGDSGSIVLPPVPGIPGIPGVPGVPSPPSTSAIPGIPGIPGLPSPPSASAIPGVPSTGAGQSIPGVPNSTPIQPPSNIPGIPNNIPGINPPNS